jgi:hypothetical protein
MRKITIITVFCFVQFCFAQTEKDTKDFIIENINGNPPKANYENFVFFDDILPQHIKELTGKQMSNDEIQNVFIFGQDLHTGSDTRGGVWLSTAETVDIRDIVKVSINRQTGRENYYVINVYIGDKYYSKKYEYMMSKGEYKPLLKMEILIADDSALAGKLKKAIIHLGKLKGVSITDGDMF